MSSNGDKPAIILLGHGSRMPKAGRSMECVAVKLCEHHGYNLVKVCYMENAEPSFVQALDECVGSGATNIVVIPYFLHNGIHLNEDIPEMVRDRADRHPNIKITLGPYLGFDDKLVSLVHQRIREVHP